MSGAPVRGRPERIPPRNGSSSIGSIPVGNLSGLLKMGQEISPAAKNLSGGKSGNSSGGQGAAGWKSLLPTKNETGNLSGRKKPLGGSQESVASWKSLLPAKQGSRAPRPQLPVGNLSALPQRGEDEVGGDED